MPLPAELPETIAIFPLPGALLLPRARLPLHIFEPRYLAMVDDVLKTQARLIGMIQPFEGPGGDQLHSIGCAGRLSAFSETEDGRYMVTLSGVSRFRVLHEVEGFTPYRRCDVSWAGFERDRGLKIDFVLGSPSLAARVTGAFIDRDERDPAQGTGSPSDHAPVVVDLDVS